MRTAKTLIATLIAALLPLLIYWLTGRDFERTEALAGAAFCSAIFAFIVGVIAWSNAAPPETTDTIVIRSYHNFEFFLSEYEQCEVTTFLNKLNHRCQVKDFEGKRLRHFNPMFLGYPPDPSGYPQETVAPNPERNIAGTPVPKLDPGFSGGGIIIGNQSNEAGAAQGSGGWVINTFEKPPKTRRPRKSKATSLAEGPAGTAGTPEAPSAPITAPVNHTTESEAPGLNLT